MQSMDHRLVVFDIAGTTVTDNDNVAQAFQGAFRAHGVEFSLAEVNPLMGFRKTEAIAELLKARGMSADEAFVDAVHAAFIDAMIRFYTESEAVGAMAGAEGAFAHLQGMGFRVALNSGFPAVIVEAIVDRFGWCRRGLVDEHIASDQVERGRPFPFMITELMRRFGISDPRSVVKVGDTPVDIQEGRMAGCGLVVGVTTGSFGRGALASFSPDHVIESLDELKSLIR